MHPAQLSIDELLTECEIKRTRGSGPGGQHRNKVETAVVVTHLPTGLRGEASERRSQEKNRLQAIFRLRVKLAVCVRVLPKSQPSECWKQRVAGGRISVNVSHNDFPALLAELIDWLHVNCYSLAEASVCFAVTKSQLIKFLKREPTALALVNRERASRGDSQFH